MNTNDSDVEIRRLQALPHDRCYFVTVPKSFVDKLGLNKGDLLKCYIDAGRIVTEKVSV